MNGSGGDGSRATAHSDIPITVCIPTVRAATIADAIESVRAQTHDRWNLLVIMQGDDAELRRVVDGFARRDDRIRGVWVPEPGLNRARNLGIRQAECDTVAFLDDDCEAAPDWLAHVSSAIAADPGVGLVAGSLVAPPAPRWRLSVCPAVEPVDATFRAAAGDPQLPPGSEFAGANFIVRRAAYERVGPFDEELGPGTALVGGDDLDWVLRAARDGVAIRFLPQAVVHHTSGRRFGLRAVYRHRSGYGIGHGAVAAKMSLVSPPDAPVWNGRIWRRDMWRQVLVTPFTSLRPHRAIAGLPRLVAFERAYRRCRRDYTVDVAGLLEPR
ncbi:MAG: glycosyltransferase family A protein [Ilumatobacter sp.]|uniref:glycosyltransferase family 2 protein n=1 Tax=Ilumatobacter sp. TaxID=1967498 RepID=UPI002611F533|nr:glycosyltransferase family A protein [Ilumatobacter sp.]MDJ0768694.1 glycosyltransferase family A protein [Ilumatobacter sp.]